MGVSIHYRGRVEGIQNIKTICTELAAIAEKMNWPTSFLDENWSKSPDTSIEVNEQGSHITGHMPLKGILLRPHPKCESLQFYFESNGYLCDPISMTSISEGIVKPEDVWISIKTQYAGPETHMCIIGLLKYLQKSYLPNLEVQDEGDYWKTGSVEILKEKMDLIDQKISLVKGELCRVVKGNIEHFSADELANVIEVMLSERLDIEKNI